MFVSDTLDIRPLPDAADAADWDGFAWLMGVPPNEREPFSQWMLVFVSNAWTRALAPSAEIKSETPAADAKVAKACRALIRALKQRDTPVDRRVAKLLDRFIKDNVKSPRRGAPSRDSDRFRKFLRMLVGTVCAFGGRPSANCRTGRGNIVVLLNLRPFMPPGFIPEVLPLPLIERTCTSLRAEIAELEADPSIAKDLRRQPVSIPPQ